MFSSVAFSNIDGDDTAGVSMTSEPDFKRKQLSVTEVILAYGGTHIQVQTQDLGMIHD